VLLISLWALLQIWIIPDERDAEPNYQQINLDPRKDPNKWHLITHELPFTRFNLAFISHRVAM
jgi:redox-sensitive bicupin YhaK (pirin superfamily)